jgi:hypothetical protein
MKLQTQYSTIHRDAQSWLFDLECEGHERRQEIIDYVDGIRVEVYTLINTTIYFFIDLATNDIFRTRDFDHAVDTLVYAVS